MRFIFLSALKDLRRVRHDPVTLVTWIGTPLMISLLLAAFFGHAQPKPHGLVMIADQDKTLLSALVLHLYTQDKLGDIFTVQQVPLDEGQRRINSGDGSALVIIPKGFSQAVLGKKEATIQLLENPAQSILPGIVESVTSVMVEGVWRLHQLIGDDLNRLSSGGQPSDEEIAASSVRFSHTGDGIRKYLDPPVIKVAVENTATNPGRRQVNIGEAMFPSMAFLAVLFLALGLAGDMWKEKMYGTLRHVALTPSSIAGFLGGKILAQWLIFAMVGAVSLVSGKFLINAEIHEAVVAVLWIAACGGAMYVLLVLLHTFVPSPRGAMMLANVVVMFLAMLGGCFFPFDLMPSSLAKIGRLLPNGWALIRFRDILAGQMGPVALMAGFGAVLGVTAVLFVILVKRLRWRFIA